MNLENLQAQLPFFVVAVNILVIILPSVLVPAGAVVAKR